jgi:hypothetical protein
MIKKLMLLIAAMMISTFTVQANEELSSEFTVTQVALDAAQSKAAEDSTDEDKNASEEKTKPEGGEDAEK